MITQKIKVLSDQYYESIKAIRHEIHMNPEIGYAEYKTSALIKSTLKSIGVDTIESMVGTGVVALIHGYLPGKTVLLRADMDALEIQEEVDIPYRSQVSNHMHACGHDGHTAGLLGAAMILNQLRHEFKGTIKLVFQPAEESDGGARPMIEAGVLENPKVDAAFSCHLWGSIPEGEVHLKSGPLMAAVDDFKFSIVGKAGHGGMPHLSIDPIVLCAQAISFIQTIVSRRIDPLIPAVISMGSIHGGYTHNVIPKSVEVIGTVRTFSDDLRQVIPNEIEHILKGITEPFEASYTFEYNKIFPVLINDDQMTTFAYKAFHKIIGASNVSINADVSMGGEDFSYFSTKVPSAFAFIGIKKSNEDPVLHHHPHFKWDDENLKIIAQGLSQIAIDFLSDH